MERQKKENQRSKKKAGQLLDLQRFRRERDRRRQREFERYFFHRLLGLSIFVQGDSLYPVEIIDISLRGLRFRDVGKNKKLSVGDHPRLRFYLTQQSYIVVLAEIKRRTPSAVGSQLAVEYGAELDRNAKSYLFFKKLVFLLKHYAELSRHDPNPPFLHFY